MNEYPQPLPSTWQNIIPVDGDVSDKKHPQEDFDFTTIDIEELKKVWEITPCE
jgi:hypothetical protein